MHLLYVMRQVGPTNYNCRASSKGILLWSSRHICENVVVTEEFYFYCDDWPNMAVASAVTDRSNNRILPKCHREDGFYKGVLIIKEVKCQGYKVEIQMGSHILLVWFTLAMSGNHLRIFTFISLSTATFIEIYTFLRISKNSI